MIIAIGADHAGYEIKESLKGHLGDFKDFGTNSLVSCDYPLIAKKVAKAVSEGVCEKGILICGSGIGMSIAANKIKNIRAAVCNSKEMIKLACMHNNINVLCIGARIISLEQAREIVDIFLNTTFEGGRHQTRIDQIKELEKEV